MGVLSYYLATSMDGFLARPNGSVDWLEPFQSKLDSPFDYEEYYKSVDAVLMGRKTWEVAKSFESHPYADKPAFVISGALRKEELPKSYTLWPDLDPKKVKDLKSKFSQRVWIVGGSQLASALIDLDLVDEVVQTIVPVAIGEGIPWISGKKTTFWNLNHCCSCKNGVVQLVYQRNR